MRAPNLDEQIGRVLGQRYRLLAPIGSGGSARVYLAEDIGLRRRVAVKLLHAGLAADRRFARRFEAEAQSSAQLNHPHVLAVYDWSKTDPAYLVCELLEGGSLRAMLDAAGDISPSQALLVGLHAAQGLAYAHDRGFVHRDIKPANLLFDLEGRLRIADFGIARAVAEAAWTEPEGALVGTARYAAPEQASGGVVDGRADVYGLALSLVEAITGEVPLTAPTALATMVLRQDADLVVSSDVGPLVAVLEAAGTADPQRRIDAVTFARMLRAAAVDLPRPKVLPLARIDVERLVPADGWTDAASVPRDDTGILVVDDETIDLRAPAVSDPLVAPAARRSSDPTEAIPVQAAPNPTAADSGWDDEDDDEIVEVVDRRRRWPFAVLLVLLVGAAAFAYQNRELASDGLGGLIAEEPVTHPMGSFVGRPLDSVQRDLVLNGWTASISRVRQDGSEPDQVLSQSPDPGIEYEEGLAVTLVVSDGPELRTVPELVGLEITAAAAALGDAVLEVGTVTEVADEAVPAGIVLTASAEPEAVFESGTAIDLTISSGPAPRVVPALDGQTLEQATAILTELGLVILPGEEFSETIPEGEVLTVTPAPGESVPKGAEITVVMSLGRPFVEVPNVIGMTAAEAADALQAAGFVVIDTEGPPNSEVLQTNPPVGEFQRTGTHIVIFTR